MASAGDQFVCDHSDWPRWFIVKLACKYPGCKFYCPPSKPPPLALFPSRHLADSFSSSVLSINSSVTNYDDDDEDSYSSDSAVNRTRRQSRKASKELDLEIATEAYQQRLVRLTTRTARQHRTSLVLPLRQDVAASLSTTSSYSSNHASNDSSFGDILNVVRSLSLDSVDDARCSVAMFPDESSPPFNEDASVVDVAKGSSNCDRRTLTTPPNVSDSHSAFDEQQHAIHAIHDRVPLDIGLKNLGNTCFINVVLQSLFVISGFCDEAVKLVAATQGVSLSGFPKAFLEFVDVIKARRRRIQSEVDSSLYRFVSVIKESGFFSAFGCKIKVSGLKKHRPDNVEQQDAQEFFLRLIDCWRLETNVTMAKPARIATSKLVNSYFEFITHGRRVCNGCRNQNNTTPVMTVVQVPMPGLNVDERALSVDGYLRNLFQPEVRELSCTVCPAKSATVTLAWATAPRVLVLQFVRWRSNSTKNDSKIVTDLNLRLHSEDFNYNHRYCLVSVITHKGHDTKHGHYTCVTLTPDNGFCLFDDNNVTPLDNGDVSQHFEDGYLYVYLRQE